MYLGFNHLQNIDYFICGKSKTGLLTNIESILGIQVSHYFYYIEVFGSRDLADKYLVYEQKIMNNRIREEEEYLKTPEGQAFAKDLEWFDEYLGFREELRQRWRASERLAKERFEEDLIEDQKKKKMRDE
jgi:hypothetical protein